MDVSGLFQRECATCGDVTRVPRGRKEIGMIAVWLMTKLTRLGAIGEHVAVQMWRCIVVLGTVGIESLLLACFWVYARLVFLRG